MYTINELQSIKQGVITDQQLKDLGKASTNPRGFTSNIPHDDLMLLAGEVGKLVRKPMVKVDKGDSLTCRDKAVRKIMPKVMNERGRRSAKAAILSRVVDAIEKVRKMAPNQPNLVAQLWVVYADIEVNHVDDDHWQVTDIPQGHDVAIISDDKRTQGSQFYKAPQGKQDCPADLEGFWSKAHQYA